ncbi:cytochrome P450 [Herbidospora galbida]|uniref:cytochrome P450 n=1 Tax=Herbidospora galbida TaxID=2575442 RepID=UPI001BAEE5AC|nr:cytochrome P450 [Herbidospora galbida]
MAPGGLPLLGHVLSLIRDPLAFLSSLPRCGDLVEVRVGPTRAVVVCDPELNHQLLMEDRTFDKGGLFIEKAREFVGESLGTCPHSLHRRQRRLAQPAFHQARMPGYAGIMIEHITAATRSWRPGRVFDVYAEMMGITVKVLLATMFSSSLPAQAGHDRLHEDIVTIFDTVYRRMLTPRSFNRLPTRGNRRYRQAIARVHRTVLAVLADRRLDGTDHGDLLSALLAARDDGSGTAGRGLSDTEITDNTMMFVLAGTETTASALAWAFHLVAGHPEVERALHGEVDAVLDGRTATHTDLPHLKLTGRIVTETLRLYPPGWIFTRTTTADTLLGGHRIPENTTVIYSPYLLHRRADLFDAPDRFDPDRWLPGRVQPRRHSLVPFGGGSRKCIGDTFAVTEVTLALATIASRWTLRHVAGPPVRPAKSAALYPRNLQMRAEARAQGLRADSTKAGDPDAGH